MPLNEKTLLSFCRDYGTEIIRNGKDLPDDHPLKAEMDGMSELDVERLNFFLEGILFEFKSGRPLREEIVAAERRTELPSAQSYVADWQVREAERMAKERRAQTLSTFGRRLAWTAFVAVLLLVFALDRVGALDQMAGGR